MTKVREFNCNNKNFLAEHDLQGARDERSRLNTNEGRRENGGKEDEKGRHGFRNRLLVSRVKVGRNSST